MEILLSLAANALHRGALHTRFAQRVMLHAPANSTFVPLEEVVTLEADIACFIDFAEGGVSIDRRFWRYASADGFPACANGMWLTDIPNVGTEGQERAIAIGLTGSGVVGGVTVVRTTISKSKAWFLSRSKAKLRSRRVGGATSRSPRHTLTRMHQSLSHPEGGGGRGWAGGAQSQSSSIRAVTARMHLSQSRVGGGGNKKRRSHSISIRTVTARIRTSRSLMGRGVGKKFLRET